MSTDDTHPSPAPSSAGIATADRPTPQGGLKLDSPRPPDRVTDHAARRHSRPRHATEATFLRRYTAEAALVDLVAGFDSLLAALEARPETEGPLEACQALAETPDARRLTPNPENVQVIELLSKHPSLSGHFFWKMQAATGRMAVEFGRRLGLPHTDLRPQVLAAGVMAALNSAFVTWLADPAGPSTDELVRQALAYLADGLGWPATAAGTPR